MAGYEVTEETTNFARLCNVLITVCSDVLRDVLSSNVPPQHADLYAAISSTQKRLEKILNSNQKNFLFPPPPDVFSGSVADFDISLLYVLIRNVSSINAPSTGWGRPVCDTPNRDTSLGANVERIRQLRNHIVGHNVSGKVSNSEFCSYWDQIENCVRDVETSLGIHKYLADVSRMRTETFDPSSEQKTVSRFQTEWNKLIVGFSDVGKIKKTMIEIFRKEYSFLSKNPFDPNSDTDIAMVYTDLRIEDYSSPDGRTMKSTSRYLGDFNTVFQQIDLESNSAIRRIFVTGKAGSGKTVFACKLVTDWCKLHDGKTSDEDRGIDNVLSQFDLCIPIALHSVGTDMTLSDIIEKCVLGKMSGIDIQFFEEYISINPHKVLFVMDGYDEYRGSSVFIDDVIHNRDLKLCTVLVTSRPYAIQELRHRQYMDRHVQVQGFDMAKGEEYAGKIFITLFKEESPKAQSSVKELYKEIEKKKMSDIASIPLLLLFMCYLWANTRSLPSSEAGLYTNVIKCFVGNYRGKKARTASKKTDITLDEINLDEFKDEILTMGHIAFRGLSRPQTEDELIFTRTDLETNFNVDHVNLALEIGLLSQQRGFNPIFSEQYLCFPHKTIQEYFTAQYLLDAWRQGKNEWNSFVEQLSDISKTINFEKILSFIIELTRLAGLDILQELCRNSNRNDTESYENERFSDVILRIWKHLHYTKDVTLNLKTLFLFQAGSQRVNAAREIIKACSNSLEKIIFYDKPEIGILKSLRCLSNGLQVFKIVGVGFGYQPEYWSPSEDECLDFSNDFIIPIPMKVNNARFEHLHSWSGQTPEDSIYHCLVNMQGLETIEIQDCSFTKHLKLPYLPTLQTLSLSDVTMESSLWEHFFNSLKNAPFLKVLEVKLCTFRKREFNEIGVFLIPELKLLRTINFHGSVMIDIDWLRAVSCLNTDTLEVVLPTLIDEQGFPCSTQTVPVRPIPVSLHPQSILSKEPDIFKPFDDGQDVTAIENEFDLSVIEGERGAYPPSIPSKEPDISMPFDDGKDVTNIVNECYLSVIEDERDVSENEVEINVSDIENGRDNIEDASPSCIRQMCCTLV